jgi:hypothetical protein
MAKDRRAFALALSAAVAGVTAAVVLGSFAPLHSTWMAGGGSGAAGSLSGNRYQAGNRHQNQSRHRPWSWRRDAD